MDKKFAVMCILLISMGLLCADCAGCTHFQKIEYSKNMNQGLGCQGQLYFYFKY